MEWISVEDKAQFPKYHQKVLLWVEATNERNFYEGYFSMSKNGFSVTSEKGNHDQFITHWAKIEPPKQ